VFGRGNSIRFIAAGGEWENRKQKTENRKQKTENRKQKTECRGPPHILNDDCMSLAPGISRIMEFAWAGSTSVWLGEG